MKNFLIFSWAVAVFLLMALSGCGGGSLGTGVRTLRGEKVQEPEPTGFKMPVLWAPSCPLAVGSQHLTTEVTSEFGFGAVLAKSESRCAFLVPEQAQSIKVRLDDIPETERPEIFVVEASCTDGADIPGTERQLRADSRGVMLPAPRWSEGRFFKLLVKLGPVDQGEVQLLDDDFESCPYVVPEDER